MPADSEFFIEVDSCQEQSHGQWVPGEVYLQHRQGDRILLALVDAKGTGIKPNIEANLPASMAMTYMKNNEPGRRIARVLLQTFSEQAAEIGDIPSFSLADVDYKGRVQIVEYGNPRFLLLRDGVMCDTPARRLEIPVKELVACVYVTEFVARIEDRIVLFSKGVSLSGSGTRRLPDGWGRDGVKDLCTSLLSEQNTVSAFKLSRKIVNQAQVNDLYTARHDLSSAVVYFRKPRRILICSGPPFNDKKDYILADMVANYPGNTLICGGTTAQIVSRELKREISVELKRDPAGLPPVSHMEGVDLITEGVLTLTKVKRLLEQLETTDVQAKGTDGAVARMLLQHDVLEFVVGTRVNPMHQDPALPVELELRRNLIKALSSLLETKFMKQVKVQYI